MISKERMTDTAYPLYEAIQTTVDRDTLIRIDKRVLKEYSDRGRPVDSAKLERIIAKYKHE